MDLPLQLHFDSPELLHAFLDRIALPRSDPFFNDPLTVRGTPAALQAVREWVASATAREA